MNSLVESLPVPSGLGKISVILGAIRPMSAVGNVAEAALAAVSLPPKDRIVAGGSLAGNSCDRPVWTIVEPVPLTSLQALFGSG